MAAAAFDVFEEEPVKADHPLLTLDNFICTPHIGAQTTEAQENVAVGIAEQIVDYFTKGIARGAVNIPSVSPELLAEAPTLTCRWPNNSGSCKRSCAKAGLSA